MKRLVLLFSLIVSTGRAQYGQPVTGTISGTLKGEDGTAIPGATINLHLTKPSVSRIPPPKTNWSVVTTTGGAFQLAALPPGIYAPCPRVPNSTWLNPCEWSLPTPTATISSTTPNPNITITLKRGAPVPVRVDDAGQFLKQNEGRTPGAGLLLGVSSPGYLFRLVPLVSEDAAGRNYQIVVPFSTQLTLVIHPSLYQVSDAAGHALNSGVSTKIPVFIPSGQQATLIRIAVKGIGGGK